MLVEGSGAGCPDGFRRFADRRFPSRFLFCAPHGSQVGITTAVEEVAGTLDDVRLGIDDSASFSLYTTTKLAQSDLGPYDMPADAKLDFDEQATFAGQVGRHYRMRFHVHRGRSFDLDDKGDHPHEDESDHDEVVEVWSTHLGAGAIHVTIRTQENTPETTNRLLHRIFETVQIVVAH